MALLALFPLLMIFTLLSVFLLVMSEPEHASTEHLVPAVLDEAVLPVAA